MLGHSNDYKNIVDMQIIKTINQTVAFLLELGMLTAVARWGYLQGKTTLSKYGISLLLIAVLVVLWGYFAAPKSENRLSLGYRITFEFVLFMVATWSLYKLGNTNYTIIFGTVAIINLSLEYYFGE